jgi:hypothetical protein
LEELKRECDGASSRSEAKDGDVLTVRRHYEQREHVLDLHVPFDSMLQNLWLHRPIAVERKCLIAFHPRVQPGLTKVQARFSLHTRCARQESGKLMATVTMIWRPRIGFPREQSMEMDSSLPEECSEVMGIMKGPLLYEALPDTELEMKIKFHDSSMNQGYEITSDGNETYWHIWEVNQCSPCVIL